MEEQPPAQVPIQPLVPFARNPAAASVQALDFRSSNDTKIYKAATEGIKPEFDVNSEGLHLFLATLQPKMQQYGWLDSIFMVPADPAQPNENLTSLFIAYGTISLDQVTAFSNSFVLTPTRASQDSEMLFHCLWNSLSDKGKAKMHLHRAKFQVDGQPCGLLLFKIITRESLNTTNSTLRVLLEKITNLDKLIGTLHHDIEAFNTQVKQTRDDLTAMGKESDTLLATLFKAYKAVPDPEFQRYIRSIQDRYDDGEDTTPDQIMAKTLEKYHRMKEEGQWKTKSPDQERILALEAQFKKFHKPGNTKTGSDNKPVNKETKPDEKARRQKPDWMTVAPKPGEKPTKTVDSKEYHWCSKHKSWGRHKASECQGKGIKDAAKPVSQSTTNSSTNDAKKLKLSQAMESVMNDE